MLVLVPGRARVWVWQMRAGEGRRSLVLHTALVDVPGAERSPCFARPWQPDRTGEFGRLWSCWVAVLQLRAAHALLLKALGFRRMGLMA